jgi:hypothetical protein
MLRAKNATNHPTYLCLVAPSCESDAAPPHPDMPTPRHPARIGVALRAGLAPCGVSASGGGICRNEARRVVARFKRWEALGPGPRAPVA